MENLSNSRPPRAGLIKLKSLIGILWNFSQHRPQWKTYDNCSKKLISLFDNSMYLREKNAKVDMNGRLNGRTCDWIISFIQLKVVSACNWFWPCWGGFCENNLTVQVHLDLLDKFTPYFVQFLTVTYQFLPVEAATAADWPCTHPSPFRVTYSCTTRRSCDVKCVAWCDVIRIGSRGRDQPFKLGWLTALFSITDLKQAHHINDNHQ